MSLDVVSHLYRGHRRDSFCPLDDAELVELRARQRTFNGAYGRTALGTLCSSVAILKFFDQRFYRIGLVYCILTAVLVVTAVVRRRHSRHDFSDRYGRQVGRWDGFYGDSHRIFGRPFVTAGWIVIIVSIVVGGLQLGLIVLLSRI
ncbi:hypothetical protein BS47DRAFT_1330055 [Hydnum rufescens UP504]|uniref:DUF202 domain-containing protein n=1 Tax=Hydnum rufescens UP504 TaxID=1448309 RepID=A0A9P6AVR1_9AGAM|nr:hypothetical protein BS47DRAFT_1330055 [Hydnum rufescens UP504]